MEIYLSPTNLTKNPGNLPFRLGSGKIKSRTYTFLQYFDNQFIMYKVFLVTKIKKFHKLFNMASATLFFKNYKRSNTTLKFRLISIEQQFEIIIPQHKFKKGLISGMGTVFKSITGNSDQADAEKYQKAIRRKIRLTLLHI